MVDERLCLRRSTGARKGTASAMTCGSGALFHPVIPMSNLPCEGLHAGFILNLPIKVRRGLLRRVETVGDLSDKDVVVVVRDKAKIDQS